MSFISFETPPILKTITAVGAAFVVLWGGIQVADSRYEQKEVHEPEHDMIQAGMDTFSITTLKKEIREIRSLLRTVTDPAYRQSLEDELYDAIGRLCNIDPNDRECK